MHNAKSNQTISRSMNNPVFDSIRRSCANELRGKGFDTEVYFVPGGVGIKILKEEHPSIAKIAHLPVSEFDFSLVSNPTIENLGFFKLDGLKLSPRPAIDFAQLSSLFLKCIHADGTSASDFTFLSKHPLEELSLRKSKLESLSCIKETTLRVFNASNTILDSLDHLNCIKLKSLDLFKCPIADVSLLSDSSLEELNISGTKVFDLTPLKGKPLRKLEMRATRVSDLAPLEDSPLEVINLPGSPIRNINCLSYLPIRDMNLIGLKLDDLTPLRTMPIKNLRISPETLSFEELDFLSELDLTSLCGPGDPLKQSPYDFIAKYGKRKAVK